MCNGCGGTLPGYACCEYFFEGVGDPNSQMFTPAPRTGYTYRDTDTNDWWYYSGSAWLPQSGVLAGNTSILTPVQTAGNTIATHDNGDGAVQNIQETITTLSDDGNGLITYTNEAGQTFSFNLNQVDMDINAVLENGSVLTFQNENGPDVSVDICQIVADNCNATLNVQPDGSMEFYDNAGVRTDIPAPTPSEVTALNTGHIIASHDDGSGNLTNIQETVTVLSLVGTIINYTDENGSLTSLDLSQFIDDTNNTSNIVNTVVGNLIGTHTNGAGDTVQINETITELTLVGNVLTFTDEAGNDSVLTIPQTPQLTAADVCNMVATTCNATYVFNPDGTATFTDNAGNTVNIPAPVPSVLTPVVTSGNIIATHDDGSGTPVNLYETATTMTVNADGSVTYTNEAGNAVTIPAPNYSQFTNTILGNQIGTHTSGNGNAVDIFETVTEFEDITNGWRYTDEAGNTHAFNFVFDNSTPSTPQLLIQLDGSTVSAIPLNSYDVNINTAGGLVFDPTTDEIRITETDGEVHVIDITPMRTTVSSNDGSATIVQSTNLDGSTNYDISVNETVTTLNYVAGTNSLTYTDENGNPNAIPLGTSGVTNTVAGNQIATHTGDDGTVTNINETVTGLTIVGNILTFSKEDGTTDTIDLSPYLDNSTTTSSITGTSPTGNPIASHNDGDGNTVSINESVTTMTINPDGSVTYVNEAGVSTTIPAQTYSAITNTVLGNQIATHTSGDGVVANIFETVTEFNSATNGWTYTDENGDTNSFAFVFDNSTPSNPQLLVQIDSATVSTIPLNSYDVNIQNGGLALNPTTDVITITETDGQTHTIDLTPLRTTVTSTDNSATIAQSVNADGSNNYDISVNETLTTLAYVTGTNSLTYVDENGTSNTVALGESTITSTVAGNQIAVHTTDGGAVTPINETITSISLTGDTITYVDEAGNSTGLTITHPAQPTAADICAMVAATCNASLTVNADGSLTHVDNAGTVTNVPAPVNSSMVQANTSGNLVGTHTAGGTSTQLFETNTTVVENADNSFTHTNESGTATTVDFEYDLTLVGNTVTLTKPDGSTDIITIPTDQDTVSSLTDTNANTNVRTIAVHDDGTGNTVNIEETITGLTVAGNILTYTKEDGTTDTVDLSIYVDDTNLARIVGGNLDPNTGISTFTRDDGSSFTIDFSPLLDDTQSSVTNTVAGHRIATHSNGIGTDVDIYETITILGQNADNSFTYTNETGAPNTISYEHELQINAAGTGIDLIQPNGGVDTVLFPTTATSTMNDNGNKTYTHSAGGVDTIIDTNAIQIVTVPDTAFLDPTSPTQAEFETWFAANGAANKKYVAPGSGTATDPDWTWFSDCDGNMVNDESPATATPFTDVITATDGQTVIPLSNTTNSNFQIQVFVEGERQVPGVDYTQVLGTEVNSITLTPGANGNDPLMAGEIVVVDYYIK